MQMKICKKCEQRLPVEMFSPGKSQCRKCRSAYSKAWAKANPEKRRASLKAWAEANPERISGHRKAYYAANRDKRRACSKNWQKANPERDRANHKAHYHANLDKFMAYSKNWQKANPEKIRAYNKKWSEKLPDSYIVSMLTQRTRIKKSDIPPELIKLKRVQLQITRKIKETKS